MLFTFLPLGSQLVVPFYVLLGRLNDQLDEALNTIRREPLRTPLVELGSMKALSTATEHAL